MAGGPEPFPEPPTPTRSDGETRRVGVEIEFAGLSAQATAEIVASLFDGAVQADGKHALRVETEDGPFDVKLDMRRAAPRGDETALEADLMDRFRDAATSLVPVEVACPPLPTTDLQRVERLFGALAAAGAVGGQRSLLHAFGLHLNVELAARDSAAAARETLNTLRAYMLLEDWLREEIKLDPTRRALAFAAPFPRGYQQMALDPAYAPDAAGLAADYVDANPTRNRGLDLLPPLAWLAERAVSEGAPDEKVSPRPAFHYRLPNSLIGDPDWSLALEWGRWLAIERLADDAAALNAAAETRRVLLAAPLSAVTSRPAEMEASRALGARYGGAA